jgi:beta-lactamase class A
MVLMDAGKRSFRLLYSRITACVGKLTAIIGLMALGACASTIVPSTQPPRAQAPRGQAPRTPAPVPRSPTPLPPVSAPIQRPTAPPVARPVQVSRALESAIKSLGANFGGSVGIAVRDVHQDWMIEFNGRKPMPQQSVSKLWVATTLLDGVDKGRISLSDSVTIRPEDLTLFHQPIRSLVGKDGYTTTVSSLLDRAMTQSDNTANDALLRRAGGPGAVRAFLTRNGLTDIRFGPGERLLQAGTAGLTWQQSYSRGVAFQEARNKLSRETREAALNRYLASPPDGATAIGLVNGLARLKRGEMLSSRSTDYLIQVMTESKTGPKRLKGGIAPDWRFAHKTGTGQELAGRATGYNDIALLTAPDGRTYAVAVMIGETRRTIPERMSLMQAVTRAIIANH